MAKKNFFLNVRLSYIAGQFFLLESKILCMKFPRS